MEFRKLGNTGIDISVIGMGCSGIGKNLYRRNDKESLKTLAAAYDSGINYFDTAPNYSMGESELLIGRALKNKREKIIIATKTGVTSTVLGTLSKKLKYHLRPVRNMIMPFKNILPKIYYSQRRSNFSPDFIHKTVEGSLRRLQTDYIDILYLHHPTNEVLETGSFINTFNELAREGKVRFFGISCDTLEQAFLSINLPHISVIQIEISLIEREMIQQLLPAASSKGIGIIARNVLAKGLLTGNKSTTKAEIWSSDKKIFMKRKEKAEKLQFLENDFRTSVQSALKFILLQKEISSALPGISSRNHLKEITDTLNATDFTTEELEKIYSMEDDIA